MTRPTRFAAALILSLALAACGSSPTKMSAEEGQRVEGVKLSGGVQDIAKKEGKVELDKDKRVNCEKITPIGSHRPVYRCLTQAEKKTEADQNQSEIRKMVVPPPSASGTIGN